MMESYDIANRRVLRREYWCEKYIVPDWTNEIHLGTFSGVDITFNLQAAVNLNTQTTYHDLMEHASVYSLATQPRLLDFACGSGDLISVMAERQFNLQAVGIDIASTAIEMARRRISEIASSSRIKFVCGDLQELDKLLENGDQFDIIVCRDAYYLLDQNEQRHFWSYCKRLLKPAGIVYVADLAVESGHEDRIKMPLINRQYGGVPIVWRQNGRGERVFSIQKQAAEFGFEYAVLPAEDENSVSLSYRAGIRMVMRESVKNSYEAIAAISAETTRGRITRVPYVRFIFCRREETFPASNNSFGIVLETGFSYKKHQELIKPGKWLVPSNEWSLVLGRSGSGKSTFLKLLAKLLTPNRSRSIGTHPRTWFLLGQTPELITELTCEDNIRLFAKDGYHLQSTMTSLGFDALMRTRKADDSLSGGERQRVALGQAIASAPDMLLLDEPGTGIDQMRRRQFFWTLHKNTVGSHVKCPTVVCVDHDFPVIQEFFKYIFEISHGQLVCVRHVK